MRVLVLGLSRTGTESLRQALVHLGYNDTYHGYAASVENPRDCDMWLQAMKAKFDGKGKPFQKEDWDKLLGHCQAVCDVPAACFAPELMEAYPDAKIILTNRDIDDWHSSVLNTLIRGAFTPFAVMVSKLAILTRSPSRWVKPALTYALSDFYRRDFEKYGKEVYRDHYAQVRAICAETKRDLLEYRIEEGWEPLCEFLGHEKPLSLFPTGNTKAEVNARIKAMINAEMRRVSRILLILLIILLAAAAFTVVVLGIVRLGKS